MTDSTDNALKPCPFCGGVAHIYQTSQDSDTQVQAQCKGCGAEVAFWLPWTAGAGQKAAAWADVIIRWNRRADLPPKVKPLEWDDVQTETPFGTYDFGYVGRVWTLRFCGNQIEYGIAGNYRTARAEAKDAAQHHFATRILSTLKLTGDKDD